MRIGILSPFNPACISDYLNDSDVPSVNNGATSVNTLVRELLDQGHELKIFTMSALMPQKLRVLRGKNVEVFVVPMGICPRLLSYHQLAMGSFYLPRRMAKLLKKEIDTLDVVQAHWTYEYAKAASAVSKIIPVYDTVRDWCPYQVSIQKTRRGKLDWLLRSRLFKAVIADKNITFIANSSFTHSELSQVLTNQTIPIIPNPIEKSWILDKRDIIKKHQIVSIATSLTNPLKNITPLLEAFILYKKDYPEAELHLVGNYNESNQTFVSWKENGLLDGVVLHGSVPHSELAALLDEMSCLVHPSTHETFGNILLEAMARCVPCIGGDHSGAVPMVLGEGQYGLVCDIYNPQSIYETLVEMSKPEVSEKIRKSATDMLKRNFSSEVIVKQYIDLYRKNETIS